MPFSPSMKVIALLHDPVLPYPGSRVMAPVWARSFWMSMPTSPSVPTVTGRSMVLPPTSRRAVVGRPLVDAVVEFMLRSFPSPRGAGDTHSRIDRVAVPTIAHARVHFQRQIRARGSALFAPHARSMFALVP